MIEIPYNLRPKLKLKRKLLLVMYQILKTLHNRDHTRVFSNPNDAMEPLRAYDACLKCTKVYIIHTSIVSSTGTLDSVTGKFLSIRRHSNSPASNSNFIVSFGESNNPSPFSEWRERLPRLRLSHISLFSLVSASLKSQNHTQNTSELAQIRSAINFSTR